MRLLVVEDEKKLCDMIAKSLHQAGYEVDMCNDGEEALDMIYAEMYDYIVPFMIEEDLKMFYYRGLKEWNNEKGYLMDTCLTAQDRYKEYLDYFRISYS